jgi:hypothetical protein
MPAQLLGVVGACLLAIAASAVIAWASNRSALWNMAFGAILAFGVLIGALLLASLLTRAAYPS